MKVLIPAKAHSERLQDKNFRPFSKGRSLFDIKAMQLIKAGILPENVYVSSEAEHVRLIAHKYGFNFLLRPECLARNDVPMGEVFMEAVERIPGDEDIMYVQVIDPLFDQYVGMKRVWTTRERKTDSLHMVRKVNSYLLDERLWPINCRFGPWHVPTQDMPPLFSWTACCQIITKEAARYCHYYVGRHPARYVTTRPFVNIKTLEDFTLAAAIFERMESESQG